MEAPGNSNVNKPIKVMIVDDSAIIRGLYRRMIASEQGIEIVTDAGNGEQAVRRLKETPSVEVIILDIEMPIMDGLTAIPLLLKTKPDVMILMSSTLTDRNAKTSLQAMHAGAADYIQKPTTNSELSSGLDFKSELIMKIKGLAAAARRKLSIAAPKPRTSTMATARPTTPTKAVGWALASSEGVKLRNRGHIKPRVIAIGSSTGGPEALRDIFLTLPLDINIPIVITQHMPPTFTAILANRLDKAGQWAFKEAEDGDELKPGLALIAPGGRHMLVKKLNNRYVVILTDDPAENFCKPSVDPLFRSIAKAFGGAVMGIVLTGMGNDGALGGKHITDAGGTIVAQDEASSVVWGMPGAVTDAGLCSKLVPKQDMAKYITNFITGFA